MDDQKRHDEKYVACAECGAIIQRKNYARHRRRSHTATAQVPATFAIPFTMINQAQVLSDMNLANQPPASEVASVSAVSFSGRLSSPSALKDQYSKAARAILKQHDKYTEEDLLQFLATQYPDIPEDYRLALIHATTATAQSVSHLYYLMEAARTGKDVVSQETAEATRRSLSFWNFGLMSRDRNDPNPPAQRLVEATPIQMR